jgi:hypothetical protein
MFLDGVLPSDFVEISISLLENLLGAEWKVVASERREEVEWIFFKPPSTFRKFSMAAEFIEYPSRVRVSLASMSSPSLDL